MRPRVKNIKHELVYSTVIAGSRDGNAGDRAPREQKQGSRTGGAGNVRRMRERERDTF